MRSKWNTINLGELVEEVTRKNKSGDDIEVFSVTNSSGFTKSTDYFSKEVFSKNTDNYKIVYKGEFAYNPSRINVGSIDYLSVEEKVLISPLYIVFKTDSKLDNKYLKFFLKSPVGNSQINSKTTGSVRDSLKFSNLGEIKIPLPPLQDQIRIADILSRTESLIAKRKESIRLLDDLVKSVFLDMFGDPVRNEKGFPVKHLNEYYINDKEGTKCGPFGSALKKDEYTQSGIPVWTMDNISENGDFIDEARLYVDEIKYNSLSSYNTRNGDIIISRAGTVGKMCEIKTAYQKSLISTNLIRLRLNGKLLPLYFTSIMKYFSDNIGRLKAGSDGALTHMSTKVLDDLMFPVPPFQLQNKYASVVEKVEATKVKYRESLSELEELYGSLSQRAFRGDLTPGPSPQGEG